MSFDFQNRLVFVSKPFKEYKFIYELELKEPHPHSDSYRNSPKDCFTSSSSVLATRNDYWESKGDDCPKIKLFHFFESDSLKRRRDIKED